VRELGKTEIRVDIDVTATPLWTLEHWLATRVMARLPWSK
jgi:hypothetical protein